MKPSRTAQLAAAHRAYHLVHDHPTILEDTAAIWLLEPPLRSILRIAPLRWLFWNRLLRKVRPISNFVILRSRYTEDRLQDVISDGLRQYVILGAGLDSWAIRHPASNVMVFELDQSATQEWKVTRIEEQLGSLPPNLSMVPIDFEQQEIDEVLREPQFDSSTRSFVSWLGTIYYLTHGAITATFSSLSKVCAPGSRIVFDYFLPKSTMSSVDLELFEVMDEGGTRRGEPMKTLLSSNDVSEMLQSAGFHLVEDLSAPEIRKRYLDHRSDGLEIPDFVQLCCAERDHAG